MRDAIPRPPAVVVARHTGRLPELSQASSQLDRQRAARVGVMDHPDGGRPGEFAIDHHQVFHEVRRDAEHRELELAMPGRQPEQVVQPEVNDGRVLGGLDMERRSIGQQHGEQPDHRSPSEGVAMDLLAESIEQRAFEPAGDHEVYVGGVRIQGDDDLSGLELHGPGGRDDVPDDLLLEFASPVQTLEFDAEPVLVEIHENRCSPSPGGRIRSGGRFDSRNARREGCRGESRKDGVTRRCRVPPAPATLKRGFGLLEVSPRTASESDSIPLRGNSGQDQGALRTGFIVAVLVPRIIRQAESQVVDLGQSLAP